MKIKVEIFRQKRVSYLMVRADKDSKTAIEVEAAQYDAYKQKQMVCDSAQKSLYKMHKRANMP